MAVLKCCPFCGGKAAPEPVQNENGLAFECAECGAGTFAEHVDSCDCGEETCPKYFEAYEAAVARWNTRHVAKGTE